MITFNGIDLVEYFGTTSEGTDVFSVIDIYGRGPISQEVNRTAIAGRPGSIYQSRRKPERNLGVRFMLRGEDINDLQDKLESLNEVLDVEEPVSILFSDETNREYFGIPENSEWEERGRIGLGALTFICPDPFKYGLTYTQTTNSFTSLFNVRNEGASKTPPNFLVTLKQPTTFLDIIGKDDYMRIGRPYNVNQNPYDKYEEIFRDDGDTMVGWSTALFSPDGGSNSGTMVASNGEFIASDLGNGVQWHGPTRSRSVGQVVNDYVVRAFLEVGSDATRRGRAEVYLLDGSSNIIGKFSAVQRSSTGEVDVEINIRNGANSNYIVSQKWTYKDFYGYFEIVKEGEEFTFAIAQQGNDGSKVYTRHKQTFSFKDLNDEFQTGLAAIGIHLGTHSTFESPKLAIRRIDVEKINQQPDGIPYIGRAGDVFEIDHKKEVIYKNGDPFMKKDFGSRFFPLYKGNNNFLAVPASAIESIVTTWRDRYS